MGLPGECGRWGDSPVGPQSSSECRSGGRRLAASVLGGRLGCRGSPEHQEGLQLLLSPRQRHTAPGTPWGHDGVWIWSLSPPGPTTGTSPTYPAEGAARLRSTGRAAWLLGSPGAAGRGRDVSFCLDPGSLLLRLCPRGGGMPDDNPRANMGGVVALFTECFSLPDNQITANSQSRTKSKDPPGSRGGAVPAQPGTNQLPGLLTRHRELCGVLLRPPCPPGNPSSKNTPQGRGCPMERGCGHGTVLTRLCEMSPPRWGCGEGIRGAVQWQRGWGG